MSTETPHPFDFDSTDDQSRAQIDVLDDAFARLWPDWRIRAPKEALHAEIQ